MAITTFTELLSAVSGWHQRSNLDSVRVKECIVNFENFANRRLRVRQMETSATITMSSVGAGSLPTDYLDWRSLTLPGSPVRNIEFADRAYISETYPSAPSGIPDVFTIEGSTLTVMPATTTSLILRYYQKIPALDTSNSTNWLLTTYSDIYLFGTLLETNAYIRNPDMAPIWKGRRDEIMDEIVTLHIKGKAPGQIRPQGIPTP